MSEAKITFDFDDVHKLERAFEQMEAKDINRYVQNATRTSADIVGKAIRAEAPVGETGNLQKGFVKQKERKRLNGKVVYKYGPSKSKNAIFEKKVKRPGLLGGKSETGYYPSSVEFGFLARAKHARSQTRRFKRSWALSDFPSQRESKIRVTGITRDKRIKAIETVTGLESQKVEGQHFMRKAAEKSSARFERSVKQKLFHDLEKDWTK